jgi:hypothetical protein
MRTFVKLRREWTYAQRREATLREIGDRLRYEA